MGDRTKAEEYRLTAAMLRLLAEQTRCPISRTDLIAVANSFEKLAEQVEAWDSPEQFEQISQSIYRR